jgi:hypothetical protein
MVTTRSMTGMKLVSIFAALLICTIAKAAPGDGSAAFTFDPISGFGLGALQGNYAPINTPGFMFSCFQSVGDFTGLNCSFSPAVGIQCAKRFCQTFAGGGYKGGFVSECWPSPCTPGGAITVNCF